MGVKRLGRGHVVSVGDVVQIPGQIENGDPGLWQTARHFEDAFEQANRKIWDTHYLLTSRSPNE